MLIRRTTVVYAARCEVSSLSLPSSVPHEIVSTVATALLTLLSFHCLLRAIESMHIRWCDVQIIDKPLSTRYEKFRTSSTSAD